MKVSARCDYACKALLELSLHWPNKGPLQVHLISKRQKIPMRYLVQILIQLKNMGLVESMRGKEGGYNLSMPPAKINLGQAIRRISGPLLPLAQSAVSKGSVFREIWNEAEAAMANVLDEITFEDIAKRVKEIEGALAYQI